MPGRRRDGELELHRERVILAGDHGCGGKATRDLVGDVRARQHRDRPVRDESRQPVAGGGIEPLRQAQNRAGAGQRGNGVAERTTRNRHDGEVGLRNRRRGDRRGGDPLEIGVRHVARVPARRRDRRHLFGVAARERHLVAAVAQDDGESRAPGATADDGHAHAYSLFTKSIETGTPSSENRLRNSFSTQ